MFFLTMINKISPIRKRDISVIYKRMIIDDHCELYNEEDFNKLLCIEKSRAERSGRSFLLMKVELEDEIGAFNKKEIFRKVALTLDSSIRDIDIKGWYRYPETLGIIFTEIRDIEGDFVRDQILRKVYQSLSEILDSDQFSKVTVQFQSFPEECGRPFLNGTSFPRVVSDHEGNTSSEAFSSPCSPNGDDETFESGRNLLHRIETEEKIALGFTKERFILFMGDLFLIVLSALISTWVRFGQPVNVFTTYTGALILALVLYPIPLYVFDMYNMRWSFQSKETILRTSVAVLLGAFLSALFFYLLPAWQYGRGVLFIQAFFLIIMVTGWRMAYGSLFQATLSKVGTLVLGAGECGKTVYRLLSSPLSPYEVRGFLDDDPANQGKRVGTSAVLGTRDQLNKVTKQIWAKAAILATPRNGHPHVIREILDARLNGVEVLEMPTVYERLTGRVPVRHIEDEWLLFAEGFYLLSKEYVQKLKRLMDIGVSGLLLLGLTPLMILTALAIRLDSPGPIFYRQTRVGKGGKCFTVSKFRSMCRNAESQGAQWAKKEDPRVTRVGRWIRLLRIDEIPQLVNVFRGEMSLIGPRPERPEFVKELEKVIPYYGVRHSVPPGVTGWAQVNYPYGASVEDALHKLEYDLYYIKNMSLLLDIKILLRTIGVVLLGEGAR